MQETTSRAVRISAELYEKLAAVARSKGCDISRVIEELLEAGIETQETERRQLLELAKRMRDAADNAGPPPVKSEFARMILKK